MDVSTQCYQFSVVLWHGRAWYAAFGSTSGTRGDTMMNHCTKKLLRTVGTIKWLAESLLHPLLNVYLSLHAPLLLTFL